ncbi:hypothetical protein GCM10009601_21950 [Streptomyces thermospinosisporus]|uniref:DUF3618 domain-containing protein n=1 Tax=Streptomyces thermospinosisporus TaxID=161482 RepID=A0ABN1YUB8_9ACTN
MAQHTSRTPELPQPLRAVASGLRQLPGAAQAGKVAEAALDRIGALSPRGRRIAVYAGAGVLGTAGVVEWPVALTGAAVAWFTRPRPGSAEDTRPAEHQPDAAEAVATTPAGPEAEAEPPGDRGPGARGPGDRLASSRHRPGPAAQQVHEQPAKVGDTETAAGLRKVAEATVHHAPHAARPPHGAGAHEQTRHDGHGGDGHRGDGHRDDRHSG